MRTRRDASTAGSAGSLLSIGSSGSILSIGSSGSILSIGSAGSILSIGSAGSVASVFSVGSAVSAGSILSGFSYLSLLAWRSRRAMGRPTVLRRSLTCVSEQAVLLGHRQPGGRQVAGLPGSLVSCP